MAAKKKTKRKIPAARSRRQGRPRKELDLAIVEKTAALGGTLADIAYICGVSIETIKRRKKEDEAFCASLEKGAANLRMSIRRCQYKAMADGNITMMIWMGKQHLGQRDFRDAPVPDANDMQTEFELI